MSGRRSQYLTGTRDTMRKVADEAQARSLAAEDALATLEDREARRAGRTKGLPPAFEGRS